MGRGLQGPAEQSLGSPPSVRAHGESLGSGEAAVWGLQGPAERSLGFPPSVCAHGRVWGAERLCSFEAGLAAGSSCSSKCCGHTVEIRAQRVTRTVPGWTTLPGPVPRLSPAPSMQGVPSVGPRQRHPPEAGHVGACAKSLDSWPAARGHLPDPFSACASSAEVHGSGTHSQRAGGTGCTGEQTQA